MKFVTTVAGLRHTATLPIKATAGKSTLPVLSNVLLSVNDGVLTISGTNLEQGVSSRCVVEQSENGEITIPAKTLNEVLAVMPSKSSVTVTMNDATQAITLVADGFRTSIKGIEAGEFPAIPSVAHGDATISSANFEDAIARVSIAASQEDFRPVLTAVLLRFRGGQLTFAAADSFRLSVQTMVVGDGFADRDILFPRQSVGVLLDILRHEKVSAFKMNMNTGATQLAFQVGETTLVSRLIDGTFPDFARIIPPHQAVEFRCDVATLAQAVKASKIFAKENQNVVRCELSRDPNDPQRAILKLASNASEIGESEIEVSGVIHRHDSGYPFPFRVALNVAFFLEALTTFPTDEVRLSVHTQQNPAMFLPFGADFEYRTLIMPMSPRN